MDTVESAKATNFCKSNTRSATTEPLIEKKKCGHCILRLSYSFSTNLYRTQSARIFLRPLWIHLFIVLLHSRRPLWPTIRPRIQCRHQPPLVMSYTMNSHQAIVVPYVILRLTAHIQIWGIHDTCSALASTSDCLRISSRLHLLYLVLFIYFLFFPAVIIQDCLLTQTWSIRYTDTVSLNMSGTKQSISFWPKLIIHISMMSKQKKKNNKNTPKSHHPLKSMMTLQNYSYITVSSPKTILFGCTFWACIVIWCQNSWHTTNKSTIKMKIFRITLICARICWRK